MKRKEYHSRRALTVSVENDRFREFQDLCDGEKKSVSLKISEMIEDELEKNFKGDRSPVKNPKRKTKQSPREIIDDILGNQFTLDAWTQNLKEISELERLEASLRSGVNAVKAERYFRKTGRRLVV